MLVLRQIWPVLEGVLVKLEIRDCFKSVSGQTAEVSPDNLARKMRYKCANSAWQNHFEDLCGLFQNSFLELEGTQIKTGDNK